MSILSFKEYLEALKTFDWYGSYIDDYTKWAEWNRKHQELVAAKNIYDSNYTLWNQFKPKEQNANNL